MNHVLKGFCTILSATMLFMATGCDKIGDLIDEIDPIWPPKIDESEKSEFDKYIRNDPSTGKPYDFGGMEIVIADWWSDPTKKADSEKEQSQQKYEKWVRDTYNVNIYRQKVSDWTDYVKENGKFDSLIKTANLDSKYYLLTAGLDKAYLAAKDGRLYDMGKINGIDFSKSKYNQSVKDLLSKNDSIYGVTTGASDIGLVIFYNKDILKNAGIHADELYDLQKSGEWTWDKFEEICQTIMASDETGELRAISSQSEHLGRLALATNNASMVTKTSNGKLLNNLNDEDTVEALAWAKKMYKDYAAHKQEGDEWNFFYDRFKTGKTAFLIDLLTKANDKEFFNNELNYGIVAFPKGPKGSYSTTADVNPVVLPAAYSDSDAKKILLAYDLFTEINAFYDDFPVAQLYPYVKDKRAQEETLPKLYNKTCILYESILGETFHVNNIFWEYVNEYDTTYEEICEKHAKDWNTLLLDWQL